jgi:DNA modification methylase
VSFEILQGDCIERMAEMEEASIDAVVCDPPYGIGFMGHEWDQPGKHGPVSAAKVGASFSYGSDPHPAMETGRYDLSLTANRRYQGWCEAWAREAFRVLKPGGHILASCGTRTVHRLAAGIEDAGFEIRDTILWLYGSGFPKSLDVSKAIDRAGGAEREVVGHLGGRYTRKYTADSSLRGHGGGEISAPATEDAARWEGWGTALKPSHEPIVVARKPLIGTVAANVLEHGTGGINVDGCRIGTASTERKRTDGDFGLINDDDWEPSPGTNGSPAGRWPANVVLSHLEECQPAGVRVLKGDQRETVNGKRPGGFADIGAEAGDGEPNASVYGDETITEWNCAPGCPVAELDAQSGVLKSGFMAAGTEREGLGYQGRLGASRFFYVAKTSRAERNVGLEGFEEKLMAGVWGGEDDDLSEGKKPTRPRANGHPTVKPINLMRWLVRLVTPPGGTCLDPFLGSGSTGCAAVLEGFDFIGIEREAEYIAIAKARIAFWAQHKGREVEDVLGLHSTSQKQAKAHADRGQISFEEAAA